MSQPKVPKIFMPGISKLQMPDQVVNVTMNPESFESQISSQGVRMQHSRPVPCPNVRDLYAGQHDPSCNLCHNGFRYYGATDFVGAFSGNNLERRFGLNGTWDLDQAMIIVPVRDSNSNILDVQYFDQITIPDFTVRFYQRVMANQSGVDRLQFEATRVDYVVDEHGVEYVPDIDFRLVDGRIDWVGGAKRPGYDIKTQRGVIYSVNYYTHPTMTVIGLPHQLRMVQTQNVPKGTPNIPARFPQLCVVRKDFIPARKDDDTGAPDRPEPPDGSFTSGTRRTTALIGPDQGV